MAWIEGHALSVLEPRMELLKAQETEKAASEAARKASEAQLKAEEGLKELQERLKRGTWRD